MLYKNLPEAELTSVMCIRGWLALLAACVFFLKGERGNARAVFQARKEFKQLRASYQQQRKENLEKSVVTSIPERSPFSILWKFHIGRKKRFSQLKF